MPFTLYAQDHDAPCSLDVDLLDRGERRLVLLCGTPITPKSVLAGLDAAGIELNYQQNLRHCTPVDRRPGLYLELMARAGATSTNINVVDLASGDLQCTVELTVPDRTLLPAAQLTATDKPDIYRLHVDTDGTLDLTDTCNAGLQFPLSQGPPVMLATPAPRCNRDGIDATIRITPGRQQPAKLLLSARDAHGAAVEAISYVPPPTPFFSNSMHETAAKFIDVNGIRTRYYDKGEGEVLVLVHGGQPSSPDFNAWEWQQNFDGLAKHFRVLALDRIGQGYTDNPANIEDYEFYYPLVVEHVLGFLDALELERVHLVGHSQGGWPVARIAIDHPNRVESLVIVDSTMIAPAGDASGAMRFYIYHQNDLHPEDGETPQSIRRGLESFSYTKNNITEQRIDRILTLSRTEKYRQASDWFNQHYMSPAHPTFRELKNAIWAEMMDDQLKVPTLIIWGREDPEGSFPAGLGMYEALLDAGSPVSFHAFDNAGHVAYMEYPQQFNQVLIDFIHNN